ncbi:Holliday junction branch migration protein RuvA [Limibacter armeniacum]|uniref:Holliday junction branch migration protein RuvA n=1 Tax=Limibacter armeniacum TaxID=466084 RepID=UPI002FE5E922
MYNYISGKLVVKSPTYAVIDVAGIGYEVHIPLSTYAKIGDKESCLLHTHFYVKEDAQLLYGFIEKPEKDLFLLLISISGIGPSTGLAFLSSLSAAEIKQAIQSDDVATIQSVKGVGAKTAQRVIIELKDKVSKLEIEGAEVAAVAGMTSDDQRNKQEALEALMQLGFSKPMADRSLKTIMKKHGAGLSVEQLIKLALKN